MRGGGVLPTWFQESVNKVSIRELIVDKVLIGLTPDEFKQTYRVSHEAVGAKLQLLPSQMGDQYRGILSNDPACPGLKYTIRTRVQHLHVQPQLQPDDLIFQVQGKEVFEWAHHKATVENAFYSKFRTCDLTHEDIERKAVELGASPPAVGLFSGAVSPSTGSTAMPAQTHPSGDGALGLDAEAAHFEPVRVDDVRAPASGPVLTAAAVSLASLPRGSSATTGMYAESLGRHGGRV